MVQHPAERERETRYVECACSSDEHVLRYTFDVNFDEKTRTFDPEIYTSVFLNGWLPWYKRTWRAIKYVFGYRCKFGHWDSTIMDPLQVVRLRKFLQEYEQFVMDNINRVSSLQTACKQMTFEEESGCLPSYMKERESSSDV